MAAGTEGVRERRGFDEEVSGIWRLETAGVTEVDAKQWRRWTGSENERAGSSGGCKRERVRRKVGEGGSGRRGETGEERTAETDREREKGDSGR